MAKSGRTNLMDAAPVPLEQEFSGFTGQIEKGATDIDPVLGALRASARGDVGPWTRPHTSPIVGTPWTHVTVSYRLESPCESFNIPRLKS